MVELFALRGSDGASPSRSLEFPEPLAPMVELFALHGSDGASPFRSLALPVPRRFKNNGEIEKLALSN